MPDRPEEVETVVEPISSALHRTAPVPNERFAPGALLASRYRIISRLGKGGMGEVFRADDLILSQPVALKFLPESARNNLNLLSRFYDEVRIARQISHKNVCRVYDIGEVDGQPYLSMEYIDGEDLGSLLRRIGRLPADKATEFARKLCAGVAAAHAQGVLHRDLKPANIMIDARGELRIADFGLAGIAEQLQGDEIRSGTPAYMAPEQLTGVEVSAQSDLYAVGLILYEMFTGKMPFEADTLAEVTRLRQENRVTSPATLTKDLDPAVERAILRCLDSDPKLRPASALALSGMLPGGDPLAAALAEGVTPSPELVSGSGLARSAFAESCDSGAGGNHSGPAGFLFRDSPFSLDESGAVGESSGSPDCEGAGHSQESGLYGAPGGFDREFFRRRRNFQFRAVAGTQHGAVGARVLAISLRDRLLVSSVACPAGGR